jgi:hypothetical protein
MCGSILVLQIAKNLNNIHESSLVNRLKMLIYMKDNRKTPTCDRVGINE